MPEKMTIYRTNGETAVLDAIDARHTLREHGSEWAADPWPKADAATQAPAPAQTPAKDPAAPFEARVKERGWWGIFDATGAQIGGAIRETDATAFNALSEEDKAEYVKAEAAKG